MIQNLTLAYYVIIYFTHGDPSVRYEKIIVVFVSLSLSLSLSLVSVRTII